MTRRDLNKLTKEEIHVWQGCVEINPSGLPKDAWFMNPITGVACKWNKELSMCKGEGIRKAHF